MAEKASLERLKYDEALIDQNREGLRRLEDLLNRIEFKLSSRIKAVEDALKVEADE